MESTFLEIVKQYGPWVALVVFFVWQGWLRENSMSKRLSSVEDYTRDTLQGVIAANTAAMKDLSITIHDRPCLLTPQERLDRIK